MKRFVFFVLAGLIAAGVAVAAVRRPTVAHPPTTASLMPAYVDAAKYWRAYSPTTAHPPTTASLMPAYVQAAKLGRC